MEKANVIRHLTKERADQNEKTIDNRAMNYNMD